MRLTGYTGLGVAPWLEPGQAGVAAISSTCSQVARQRMTCTSMPVPDLLVPRALKKGEGLRLSTQTLLSRYMLVVSSTTGSTPPRSICSVKSFACSSQKSNS
jgi:hypothetical protein